MIIKKITSLNLINRSPVKDNKNILQKNIQNSNKAVTMNHPVCVTWFRLIIYI